MKRLAVLLSLLALCLSAPRPAQAIYRTGEELARSCEGSTQKEVYFCLGYIAGLIDYQILMQSLGTENAITFCLPDNTTIEQASFVVLQYLKNNPMNGAFIAAPAVAMALNEKFPCASAGKQR